MQQQQKPEDPNGQRESFQIPKGSPNFQATQKPLQQTDGPKPLDSFDNLSNNFGGGSLTGVSISSMGSGCYGNKLPTSKMDFRE
jgi:hypothetical protein